MAANVKRNLLAAILRAPASCKTVCSLYGSFEFLSSKPSTRPASTTVGLGGNACPFSMEAQSTYIFIFFG